MTINQISEKLTEIGLTSNQTTVYLELIKAKKCRASAIIEQTKLHRSIVYTCLDDLIAKGLASKLSQNGVAVFEATDPKNLVEMMDVKRKTAESAASDLLKLINEVPRDIRVFEGSEGIINARERSLNLPADETIYVLGGPQLSTTQAYEKNIWIPYHKKRIKKGIKNKVMFDRAISPEVLADRNTWPLTQAKYLPFKQDMPAWFETYGQTFAIGIPAQEPILFSINSPEASSALKNFFEYLCNQNVMVENGRNALKEAINGMLDELKSGEEYCVLGASFGQYNRQEMIDFYGQYHKRRISKGVKINMLAFSESVSSIKNLFRQAGDPNFKLSQIKTLNSTTPNPMQVYLFHDKTWVVIMGQEPTIMRFEQKEVYDNFKTYFDTLWLQESYVLEGPEALQRIWLEAVEARELKFIGARGYFIDRYPKLFEEIKKLAEKTHGVVWKNVVDNGVRGHAITKYKWSQTKYSLNAPKNPNVVWIYGNKIAISNWSGDTPVIFVSENKQLHQSYNDYFEELWRL
ncbi:MAG: helix-turn-helix domain-containing protein [Patescibacteria group bacterium]